MREINVVDVENLTFIGASFRKLNEEIILTIENDDTVCNVKLNKKNSLTIIDFLQKAVNSFD